VFEQRFSSAALRGAAICDLLKGNFVPTVRKVRATNFRSLPSGPYGCSQWGIVQQLVVVEKDSNGKVTTKEIMPVLFSVLEGSDQPAFRAS
jgi:hypothetical protein